MEKLCYWFSPKTAQKRVVTPIVAEVNGNRGCACQAIGYSFEIKPGPDRKLMIPLQHMICHPTVCVLRVDFPCFREDYLAISSALTLFILRTTHCTVC